ncbi:MAG: TonB-dependent receptor, partial [Proteobacteria bacterium]|nr:TonB-dependent receptor [Pseudomonadota bacterium]
ADKWSWLLSTGYNDNHSSADVLDLDESLGGNDYQRQKLARGELAYRSDSEVEITMGAGATQTDDGAFETAGIFLEEKNELNTANGYIRAHKTFSPDTEAYFRWAGRYQDMDRPSYGSARYQVREHDFEGQVNMTDLGQHSLAFGGNFRCTSLSSRPLESDVFTLAGENVYEHWFGLFGSDRYQYSDQLLFELQLRGDYFSEGDTDWSGRLSTLYGLDSAMNHVFRISAAKAYRQPIGFIRDAVFYNDPLSSGGLDFQFTVDPEMESEQAWSLEGGYHWTIQDHFILKSELYYMWYQDLIGARSEYGLSKAGFPEYIVFIDNTGDADGYGCELELEYDSGPFVGSIWYAYNDFETEYENQSIRSFLPAQNKVGLTLRWRIDQEWTANGQYAYSDLVREDVSEHSVDSSHHLDLTLARSFFEKKGEIMFGIMDLLNKEYEPLVGLDQTRSNPVPGRTIFCRLQYRF